MIGFLKTLLAMAMPYRLRLAAGVVFGILAGLVDPLLVILIPLVGRVVFPDAEITGADEVLSKLPNFIRPHFDFVLSQMASESNVTAAKVLVIALIPSVVFLRGLLGGLNVYCLQWVAVRAVIDLRTRLFAHLQDLSLNFFARSNTGDLMSRIISDTAAMQHSFSSSIGSMVKDPVTVLCLLAVLFHLHAKLMLVTLVVFPLCLIPVVVFSRKVRKSSRAIQDNFSSLAHVMHESFTGNRIIKAYNLEDRMLRQFREQAAAYIRHFMRVVRSQEIPGPLIEFLGSVGIAVLFLYFATQSNPGADRFIQFAIAVVMMYKPVKNLIRLHSQLEQARAASRRVFELLDMKPSIADPAEPKPLHAANAPIHFDRIDFDYGDKPVLRGINLLIRPGQVVALVGGSGSGKTTLANLLLRFYDPQHGAVRIGGTDIRDVSLKDLRSQIAIVTQETILFNDTIRNNIALGRPGAADAEIEAAARAAHAHGFILEKENGYDTLIGEKGAALSGGQRQRIAIARALLKNAPILVLDEATSSLDTESERATQAALDELMQHRTTLVIAHRLSTIQHADVIVVLSEGRIIETGTHAELLQHGGQYKRLHDMQFAG